MIFVIQNIIKTRFLQIIWWKFKKKTSRSRKKFKTCKLVASLTLLFFFLPQNSGVVVIGTAVIVIVRVVGARFVCFGCCASVFTEDVAKELTTTTSSLPSHRWRSVTMWFLSASLIAFQTFSSSSKKKKMSVIFFSHIKGTKTRKKRNEWIYIL